MKKILPLVFIVLPSVALAVDFSLAGSTFKDIINYILSLIYLLIPILVGVAFLVFFWGLSKFVIGADNDQEVKKGKEFMLWGILALFILISVRSILGILSNELDFGGAKVTPLLPTNGNWQTEQVDSSITFPQGNGEFNPNP